MRDTGCGAVAPPGVDGTVSTPIDELAGLLPEGTVVTDEATSDGYRHDSASFCAAGRPLGVARPTTTEQVQTVLLLGTRRRRRRRRRPYRRRGRSGR